MEEEKLTLNDDMKERANLEICHERGTVYLKVIEDGQ
jgi:hypothetical protein